MFGLFYALLNVLSRSAIILTRELDALLCLSPWRVVIVSVLWLFLAVPWVSLEYVIVVFPYHTCLLFSVFCSCFVMQHLVSVIVLQ